MPRRRFRKWAKWACTLAAVGLFTAVAVSVWVRATWMWNDGRTSVFLACGLIGLEWNEDRVGNWAGGVMLDVLDQPKLYLGYSYIGTPTNSFRAWMLPLWPVVLLLTGSAGALWVLDRGLRAHQCGGCGYDRAGLDGEAKCPECGANPQTGTPLAS